MKVGIDVVEMLMLVALSIWDIRKKEIPVWAFIPTMLFPIFELLFFYNVQEMIIRGISAVFLAGVLLVISHFTKEQIGKADAYLVGIMVLLLGFWKCCFAFLVALFAAAIYGVGKSIGKKQKRKVTLAFIPFLAGATMGVRIWEYFQ